MPSIMLDTSLPVAMMKMHHSTDVLEVILCISNLKERKALHKALEIIEGMLDYKVCSMELLYKRKGNKKKYFSKNIIIAKKPNNNYLSNYNLHTRRSRRDITLYKALYIYSADVSISYRVSVQGVESLWGDCRFIPVDWGHSSRFVLFCSF